MLIRNILIHKPNNGYSEIENDTKITVFILFKLK